MRCKSAQPKWVYDFDCDVCENLQYVNDPAKHRDGLYCIPVIEAVDRRPADWTPFNPDGSIKESDTGTIHADEHDRHVRCDCFKRREDCQMCFWNEEERKAV